MILRRIVTDRRAKKINAERDQREKMRRLEDAEQTLRDLQDRKDRALHFLVARDGRNHWRESIEQMIHGVS